VALRPHRWPDPALIRAQSTSKPVRIGLLSDMSGPYRDVGGPGNKVATELAIADFGGSVLGRPIEVLQADDQDKPDVSTSIARQWIDDTGVDVLADGAASSSGLAIQQVCREKKRIYLITGPATSDMTGKQCSPVRHAFLLRHLCAGARHRQRADQGRRRFWFFITADYAFGYALERDTMDAVKAAGGKVLGAVRAPLATADFSSYLVQAQASGAKVIGLANAGTDTQNCVKQAAEFGLTKSGIQAGDAADADQRRQSLGQKVCEGLTFTDSFYWDMTDKTRAWSKRWSDQMGGMVPGLLHAGSYCAANHWLKAVKAAGTTDADAVVGEDERVAGQRFLQRQREDPAGRAGHARDVSVAGQAGGRGTVEVRFLQ
jgi:branched-chain amino acid transport system substrate-binding protein